MRKFATAAFHKKALAGRVLALCLLLYTSGAAQTPPPPRSGVLVGTTERRSLWIRPAGDSIQITEIPVLLVPRKDGFWAVRTINTIRKDREAPEDQDREWFSGEEILFIQPAEREPALNLPEGTRIADDAEKLKFCESIGHEIRHINPGYVFYEWKYVWECGSHPDVERELYAVPIDGFGRKRMAISDAFGMDASEAFEQGVRDGVKADAKERGSECAPEKTDERNWTIERGQGRWVVRGWAETHRLCGYGIDFDIPRVSPKPLVGHDELAVPWERIQQLVPDAYDAFSSPAGDLLVVFRRGELLVFRLPAVDFQQPVARYKLRAPAYRDFPPEKAVLIEWAVGRHVARWNAEILKLKPRFEKKAVSGPR